ncbi:isoleucine--tRNA ligase [Weeksella virosa]|uniref:Isoleucine--tRNA ligase n=1 Tax=Weeksella virosa (strain ATCC 43766 / DSM 16922 / JCM 21250 / CCUG 30538 / CDC 9751 / IAM 14551 / NBRC 16016 / NCTC 11634 / CL345/78) TaxID=865938 RepID=F0NYC7_WEEVC|nr:isoleucine--tRNA ligase [Weeksella virosa]ADX68124.1 Isoleucyl-tRNA synthetase [Weeksella virosa DSM 16922]VEH64241.1 Isoleucine--tRNA ligase [Weeksella virosa]
MAKNFKEYKHLNLVQIADETLKEWKEQNVFEKSITSRDGKDSYVFYEGPPSANGKPGIHHVLARSIKDIFCRFQTLKGKQVIRKAGWDTHGLPVELGTEKELGITKEDIGTKITIEQYNEACKRTVMRYTDLWNNLTEKMGYWVDMDDPYITYKPKYMETVWWLLKQIYDKGYLYKGYTIQPYSPKAGTGLSSHELNQPGTYQEVTDTTIVAQFKVDKNSTKLFDNQENDVYILAWTTTPWTLPSNTALTVGPNIDYVVVETFNQYTHEPITVVLAKALLSKQFTKPYHLAETEEDFTDYTAGNKTIPYRIIREIKGKDLVGIRYEQLLPWALPYENADNAFQVIPGDFVTTEDGTGIVHTAPTFGADDARVAKDAGVPPMLVLDDHGNAVPLVDLQGRFVASLPKGYGGKFVKNEYYDEGQAPEKSVDVEIAILLKEQNRAFKVEKYKHSYPHCWRTDKPILYYPLDSWFIKVTEVKDRMVELNKEINWKPKATGEGRFGNWLENVNDWNLSRSRYWGIPLPVWRTEDGEEEIIIGSVEELVQEIEKSIAVGIQKENPFKDFEVGNMSEENYDLIDLHKNVVDEITLVSASGKPMKREADLIDVWFDSGAMPYAQVHYPFENKELIDNHTMYPADFIAEGVDQTRGWFYTLHAIATLVFDSKAYKNVMSNGLVLDKNGQKMSKRLGNAIDPFDTLETYGPDATRWYMIANAQPWENLKFDLAGVDEVRRKFFGTLYNTYSFFALYANVDGFTYAEKEIPVEERDELDQWILSELNTLIQQVDEFFSDYEPTKAARAIQEFVIDNLSNWHVRLSRRRFWKGDYSKDKIAAYQTLYTVLETVAILSSPIAPFFMDRLYKDLNDATGKNEATSVHLANFPQVNQALINEELQEQTRLAQLATSMILSLRKLSDNRVRQPLQKVMIPVLNETMKNRLLAVSDLLKQEVNVKEIQLLTNEEASDILVKSIKPNFKTLGPKFGKDMKAVAAATAQLTNEQIVELENTGYIELEVNGEKHTIEVDDFEIATKDIPGWTVASNAQLTVALDLTLTQALIDEGISRELVNRIQNLRKENGFEVTDRIDIIIEKNPAIEQAVTANMEYVRNETLADNLTFDTTIVNGIPVEINDEKLQLTILKH